MASDHVPVGTWLGHIPSPRHSAQGGSGAWRGLLLEGGASDWRASRGVIGGSWGVGAAVLCIVRAKGAELVGLSTRPVRLPCAGDSRRIRKEKTAPFPRTEKVRHPTQFSSRRASRPTNQNSRWRRAPGTTAGPRAWLYPGLVTRWTSKATNVPRHTCAL